MKTGENRESNCRYNYDDIIKLPHHVSTVHPPMPAADRAAQFSPFAALTGFGEAVKETARLTDERRELDEDARGLLDEKLRMLLERAEERPEVEITYFQPDRKKAGGTYVTIRGIIKRTDSCKQQLIMEEGERIPLKEIVEIKIHIPDPEFRAK